MVVACSDRKWIDDVGSASEDESVGCPSEASTARWKEEAKLAVRCASPLPPEQKSATVAPCVWLCATSWHTDVEPNSTLTLGPGRYSVLSAVSAIVAIGADVVLLSGDEPYCFELEDENELTVVVDIAVHEEHEAAAQPVKHGAVGGDDDVEVAAWRETLATASFSSMMRLLQKRRGVFGWLSIDGEATAVWRSTAQ